MSGTLLGSIFAFAYFIFFQFCGLVFAWTVFREDSLSVRILGGSVMGSVLIHWMPTFFSFFLDFTTAAHMTAALVTGVFAVAVLKKYKPFVKPETGIIKSLIVSVKPSVCWLVTLPVYLIFALLVVGSFEFRDGAMYSGQATYGDTCMHLGFITSIAEQGTFPPDYSILPGARLSYPFLSDSISSSLYVWGAGLKFSYCLPMFFAGAQVMFGLWTFLSEWLKSASKSLLAWVLFLLNGGFGFAYFLNGTEELSANFTRIFTQYYETPTNFIVENIRWVNVIVDMLLPQRATLFGYAVLFFTLWVLYKAVWGNRRELFPVVGVLAGSLPMIHTHSFVSLAIISGAWLVMYLAKATSLPNLSKGIKLMFLFVLIFMQTLQVLLKNRESDVCMIILAIYAALFVLFAVWMFIRYLSVNKLSSLLTTWGVYLLLALVLALPQLMTWTLNQASGDGFIRGYFNWANINDNYIWFYIKNIGIAVIMFAAGIFSASKKNMTVIFPVIIIWIIAELAVFQPNVYDNNKFLYVAYIFVCGLAADFMMELYGKIRSIPGTKIISALTIFVCVTSALLTIGREFVAEYEVIGVSQCDLAEYLVEYTSPEDTILTDQRHNNSVTTLAGRNIVCGSPSYLYYHGLDYAHAEYDAKLMFEAPFENISLFEEYSVDYVLISDFERSSYCVDEGAIQSMFTCVYNVGDTALYAVN